MSPISVLASAKTSAKISCLGTLFLVPSPPKPPPRPLVPVPTHAASRALRFARRQRKRRALRAIREEEPLALHAIRIAVDEAPCMT
jgi:hypothetical protein